MSLSYTVDEMTFPKFCHVLDSPCYIINLQRCTERWDIVYPRVKQAGFTNIQRWEAIDGREVSLNARCKNLPFEECSAAAKACFLSHIQIWKHIQREGIPLATVFEDDVLFHPLWNFLAHPFYKLTPKDFDILYFGSEFHPAWMATHFPGYKVNGVDQIPVFCTHAYTITYVGACKLLELVEHASSVFQIDLFLWTHMKNHLLYKEPKPFQWYSWQGIDYPCKELDAMHPRWQQKNTGLVFQDYALGSLIDPELYESTKKKVPLPLWKRVLGWFIHMDSS